jgi:hypothetical protein
MDATRTGTATGHGTAGGAQEMSARARLPHSYARVMEPRATEPREMQLREVLASVFADQLVVLAGGPVAGATGRVASLRALGARRCLVLGAGRGT